LQLVEYRQEPKGVFDFVIFAFDDFVHLCSFIKYQLENKTTILPLGR
jgi:hypothetical protein